MHARELVIEGPSKNALSSAVMTKLCAGLAEAKGEPLLVRGEGDTFSAGLDLREVASLDSEDRALAFFRLLEKTMAAFYTYPGPLVACANGHAIAGGCVILVCADWRVAQKHPKTKIGLNEVALGVEFPPHTLQIVRDRVPPRSRDGVLLGAGLYGVDDALSVGLVDEVSDDALARAKEELAKLASLPRQAYAATKRQIRAQLIPTEEQERKLRDVLPAWTNPEVRQRVLAVLK